MARKLRIAASVFFAVVAVALVVLWVRSYYKKDDARCVIAKSVVNVQSLRGELGIGVWAWKFKPFPANVSSQSVDDSMERLWPPMTDRPPLSFLGIRREAFGPDMTLFAVKFWTLVLLSAGLFAFTWIGQLKKRFSLRTLLIVMTLVAVVLGLVMWAVR